MRKSFTSIAFAAVASLAFVGTAAAENPVSTDDWSNNAVQQQSIVKVVKATTGGLAKKGDYIRLDTYLSTRDPDSTKPNNQPQAVGTVRMYFPKNSSVNTTLGKCFMYPTAAPWDIRRMCGANVVGEGWALVAGLTNADKDPQTRMQANSGGTTAPSGTGNYADAPADCATTVSDQFSRTYQAGLVWNDPLAGLACTPRGYIWVHVYGYAGSGNIVGQSINGVTYMVNRADGADAPAGKAGKPALAKADGSNFAAGDVYPKTVTWGALKTRGLTAGKALTSSQVTALKSAWTSAKTVATARKSDIIFTNDNGIAALSFAGSITKVTAPGVDNGKLLLSVDLPAFNAAQLKGFLPLDTDLVDFRFATTSNTYLKAGDCTVTGTGVSATKTYQVKTVFGYSQFPGDYAAGNLTKYPDQTVNHTGNCTT